MTPRTLLAGLAAAAAIATPAIAEDSVPADKRAPIAAMPELTSSKDFDASGWTRLGHGVLSGKRTTELIPLRGGAFDQLTFVVDGDLQLSGITVVTAGGERVVRGVQHKFWASSRSRQIELSGNTRPLRSVAVLYKLAPAAQVVVTVYGRAGADVAPGDMITHRSEETAGFVTTAAEAPRATSTVTQRHGWTLLGAQTVSSNNDSDVIRVPARVVGIFNQLAIVASGGDLELKDMKLRFAGGQTAEIDTRYYFRGTEHEKLVTLPAGDKIVRAIQLRYGNDRGEGKTRVEVWAR